MIECSTLSVSGSQVRRDSLCYSLRYDVCPRWGLKPNLFLTIVITYFLHIP